MNDEPIEAERPPRRDAINAWVEYINSTPVEQWGPQHTALVNDQLAAAQSLEKTAAIERRIRRFAAESPRNRP